MKTAQASDGAEHQTPAAQYADVQDILADSSKKTINIFDMANNIAYIVYANSYGSIYSVCYCRIWFT